MQRLRTLLFWLHLAVGLAAGLVVLTMSATGVLLTYQRQITAWADARALVAAPPAAAGAAALPVATLVARVQAAVPGTATAVTWRAGRDRPVEVAYGRERTVFADARTGAVLGEGSRGAREFFRTVVGLHRWLGAGEEGRKTGKAITGAANLGFLCLVVSGFWLWWPRNRTARAVRNVALFRRGLQGKARDFNWHNVVGLWSAVPLFVVVLAGVVISYRWASDLVYVAVGESPPPQGPPGGAAGVGGATALGAGLPPATTLAGIDALRPRAEERLPGWRSVTLQLPKDAAAPVTFALDAGSGGEPQRRAQLTFDRATGAEVRWEPFAAGTPGRRLRSILRFAHTGEVLGVAGQTVAGVVSLGAVVLVLTGVALSVRRLAAWRGRRRRGPAAPAAARGAPAMEREPATVG